MSNKKERRWVVPNKSILIVSVLASTLALKC